MCGALSLLLMGPAVVKAAALKQHPEWELQAQQANQGHLQAIPQHLGLFLQVLKPLLLGLVASAALGQLQKPQHQSH